jgi:hypothetical protein
MEYSTITPPLDRYQTPALLAVVVLAILALALLDSHIALGGNSSALADTVAPQAGVELPVVWGTLGTQLVRKGVIDREKFVSLYGELSAEETQLLDGENSGRLRIARENASYLLNLFWALGLANANSALTDAEGMENPAYGGAGSFASTGGWTLSRGSAMGHYGAYTLIPLTEAQGRLVKKVADGIYRPCCDNPTSFPDCNHGMAMLGLLELMASQNVSEEEMWKTALAVNSYWFPDTYETIATYLARRGVKWGDADPREVLGKEYSSYSGFARVLEAVGPRTGSGASCGV